MEGSFELFDHTADMGIRVRAATLPELLDAARRGMYEVIGELKPKGSAHRVRFDLTGRDTSDLLREYLAKLLLLFECDHLIVTAWQTMTLTDVSMQGMAECREVDQAASVYHREVKAVTYHELAVERTADGYTATFIVDI